MDNKAELLRLLRLAWAADHVSAADCKKIDAILAAPAEDVRAVGEEPVACYVATDDLEAIQSGSRMWATAWATDSAMNPSRSFSQALYRHPQRPVVLPERKPEFTEGGADRAKNRVWNACIDEFERLNEWAAE